MSDQPRPFICMIPTFDLYGYLPLIMQLVRASTLLNRPLFPVITDRWGVWHSLTEAVVKVGERLNVDTFRGLIVGSDTHISNPDVLAEYVAMADNPKETPFNFVANVHMRGDQLKGIDGGYNVTGLDADDIPDLAVVHPKGYGFYYGDISTKYVWHSDAASEESVHFLEDNSIEVRYAKRLKLLHYVRRFT